MQDREPVPDPIKREVRQRCGFGCVICGCPLYEYDHIFGYKPEQGHIANEITLLCDRHHKEKTIELLSLAAVIEANASPRNIAAGVSTPYGLHFKGISCRIDIAGGTYVGFRGRRLVPLVLFDEELVSVRFVKDELYLSCQVRDRDGEVVLLVSDNELIFSTDPWDVEFAGRTLTVRCAKADLLFRVVFNPPSGLRIDRMNLVYGDATISANSSMLKIEGPGYSRQVDRFYMEGHQYGISFRSRPPTAPALMI